MKSINTIEIYRYHGLSYCTAVGYIQRPAFPFESMEAK